MRTEQEISLLKGKKYQQWCSWEELETKEKAKGIWGNRKELKRYREQAEICFKKYLLLVWVLGDEDLSYKYYNESG